MLQLRSIFLTVCLVTFSLVLDTLSAAPLDGRVTRVIDNGASARALWGVYAVDLSSGEVLVDINSGRLFVPASNRKLVSTALAATVFQPDTRLRTEIRAPEPSGGVIRGNLTVHATGDPSWTPRLMNGRPGTTKLREMARQISMAGIERIEGDLVIATGRFGTPAPLGPGWTWEDLTPRYGSRASVFAVNHNLGTLQIRPGNAGQPVIVSQGLPVSAFNILNESRTGAPGSAPTLLLERDLNGSTVTFTGSLPADSNSAAREIPLGDPVLFWGQLLAHYLEEEGVSLRGDVRLAPTLAREGRVIGAVEGATLAEMLTLCNEDSDNFIAEALYLLASAERYGVGSYEGSHQMEAQFWQRIGVDSRDVKPADGSGLSRENFISPQALVALLQRMEDTDWFVESLPVSGRTGTLRYRLSQNGMAGRVRAKTGTLTGISGLSGYVTTNSRRTVAFSVIANHYTAGTATIRRDIDAVVEILAGQ